MAKRWIVVLGCLVLLGLSVQAEAKETPFDPVSIKERVSYRLVKQDQAYRVDNSFYEASFTEKGLSFVPLRGEGVKGEEMGFSLKAIHAGDEVLSFTKEGFEVEENRITYALSRSVEEVYIAREEGVEQVFYVNAPLSSKQEDLVFTVAVETGLRTKAGPQGIGFFDETGKKVASYGTVTVFDARGREMTFLPELTGELIALVVPGAFLKDAAYPVTVDPLIGSDFAICDEALEQSQQAMAFDGTNYLVVWHDARNGNYDIYGQRVNTVGGLVGTDFAICNQDDYQTGPAVAFDGTNYLVVWELQAHPTYDIHGQQVSTAGGLVGENFVICNEDYAQSAPSLAFDGTNYLVAWTDGRNGNLDIYGQLFGREVILHRAGAVWMGKEGWDTSTLPYTPGGDWARDMEFHLADSGDFVILHKCGAVWDSDSGWDVGDPYTPGFDWAVDWEFDPFNSEEYLILHKAGAVWKSWLGTSGDWDTGDPYTPGFDWAADLEVPADGVYYILHKAGACWNSDTGWDVGEPYTPGSDWAVDWEFDPFNPPEYLILHKAGAVWKSWLGTSGDWDTGDPYTPGLDWAVDLEVPLDGVYYILHKAGARWNSDTGWDTSSPPYTPGVDWAVDSEFYTVP